ncbi:MAG TPA: type II secretion system F family protein [Planctomycetaceae bacterium]|jgi:type II secretory pathway component PulF|nr:type II secretion system F family protein [Planctomycetaceae bacterium]
MDLWMPARVSWWPAQPDELTALKSEISCLRKVGIPLSEGLREVAQDQPERLSQIALWVAERLDAGVKLSDALAALTRDNPLCNPTEQSWRRRGIN